MQKAGRLLNLGADRQLCANLGVGDREEFESVEAVETPDRALKPGCVICGHRAATIAYGPLAPPPPGRWGAETDTMSRLEELPPDQRAALSILLRQRKTYAEVAAMLGISERAVHDRAHAALAVLAPGPAESLTRRRGRRSASTSSASRPGWQNGCARGRCSPRPRPPRAGPRRWQASCVARANCPSPPAPAPGSTGPGAQAQAPYSLAEAAASPSLWEPPAAPSSRVGGALLLAAIVVAVVVVLIVVFVGGGSSKKTASNPSTTTSSTSGKTAEPKAEARFTLKSPEPHSRSTGEVEILSEDGKQAFYIKAEHIPATKHFFYAVWLYNSPSSALPLSKSPPVGKSHTLAGAALLPENAGEFHEILLTRETNTHPTHPGHVVLRGRFSLKS